MIDQALSHTLKWEGGFVDDTDDPGGRTNYGISQRQYPDLDIENLTLTQAKNIYIKDYWNDLYNGIKDPRLCIKLFDLGVNVGVNKAVKILQETLNIYFGVDLKVDGIFGIKTLSELNKQSIFSLYVFEASLYYKCISFKTGNKYFKGWLNRLYDF